MASNKGRIIFYEEGSLKILWGGHIFSEPKKGGSRFFPEFNIKYFFKKKYAISEIRV